MVRRRVVVHGRVQGVFFRGATQVEARAAGVAGWVRNLPDGTVEAVFEGPADRVDRLLAFCAHGPPAARVTRLDTFPEPPEGLTTFDLRR
jgi:acylphosphatase